MISATVSRWSAWAPDHESHEDWRAWSQSPTPLPSEGHPDAHFVPALLRRRCTPLSRIMLTAAYACCREDERAGARTVFASRHGSINESLSLLEAVAQHRVVSPAKFSHTVHNAQAGLFSIAASNREASSSLAAEEDTFAAGYLEALTHLERDPERSVLLVVGDVPLAPTFAPLVDEPAVPYALGLLLQGAGPGTRIDFSVAEQSARAGRLAWPDALEFLRWLLADEPELELGSGRLRWIWKRQGEART